MGSSSSAVGHLAVLLHMHQPLYTDPESGVALLPWVRLHTVRGYSDIAAALEAHPDVRLNVNFVPSLVQQIDAVAAGQLDAWTELALRDIDTLQPSEKALLLERLFSIHWGRAIEPRARYRELLEKRGRNTPAERLIDRVDEFSTADLRDLTVLFYLGWFGFSLRNSDPGFAALEQKARDYSQDDLRWLVAQQQHAAKTVLDRYRALADRGQIELSPSPAFHPIVPLVIDTETARRARQDLPMPPRFLAHDDARAQVVRAVEQHAARFGQTPSGMWPAEGSVSPEALAIYRAAGIRWLVTDEEILWRSLRLAGRADVPRKELYRVHRYDEIDLLFRDHDLSDRIGFRYAHDDAERAVDDLMGHAERHLDGASGDAKDSDLPVVTIALDGENPWESFPDSGAPFLHAWFSRLEKHPRIRSATISDVTAQSSKRTLPRLHSGSWINADFHIWIGDPVKNRAWTLLGEAARRLDDLQRSGTVDAGRLSRARERLLAAEGSDWFWWFGEPFHSSEDGTFDRLFRAHLRGCYEALGLPIPAELGVPVDDKLQVNATRQLGWTPPQAMIRPRIGERASYFAWRGAGRLRIGRGAAMADSPWCSQIDVGFDAHTLFVRVVPASERKASWLSEAQCELAITTPRHRLRVRLEGKQCVIDQAERDGWSMRSAGALADLGTTAECAIPLASLGVGAGETMQLCVRMVTEDVVLARYPADGAIDLVVPTEETYLATWCG